MLDEQARGILRMLRPEDRFSVRGDKMGVYRCVKVEHPVEAEPFVRCQEQEGPRGSRRDRMFRAIRVSLIDEILPERAY